MFQVDGINPHDFEEFHEANALQKEMFFWVAEKVVRKSRDRKFLNKCVGLMRIANYENAILGQALANVAHRRLLKLDFWTLGTWRFAGLVIHVKAFALELHRKIRIPSKERQAKDELRKFLRGVE